MGLLAVRLEPGPVLAAVHVEPGGPHEAAARVHRRGGAVVLLLGAPPRPAPPGLRTPPGAVCVCPSAPQPSPPRLALRTQGPADSGASFVACGDEEGALSIWDLTEAEETHEARSADGICLRIPTYSSERRARPGAAPTNDLRLPLAARAAGARRHQGGCPRVWRRH